VLLFLCIFSSMKSIKRNGSGQDAWLASIVVFTVMQFVILTGREALNALCKLLVCARRLL